MHIGDYSHSDTLSHENIADRKLLLHRKEINTIGEMIAQKGKTLIPMSLYFKKDLVKKLTPLFFKFRVSSSAVASACFLDLQVAIISVSA